MIAVGFVFALTAFTGALLVFLLEPMFVKMALPRLGGSSQVWTACVLCYQILLLAAYGYVHLLRKLQCSLHQALVHGLLCVAAIFALPPSIPPDWQPHSGAAAVPWLVATLMSRIGLPFFVLTATSPLMLTWFALARPGRDPYRLYAAGNIGSLVALMSYPFIVEPLLGLRVQSNGWAALYGVMLVLLAVCAYAARVANVRPAAQIDAAPIARSRRLRWLALAAIPASLMLSVTAYLSERVAPIPLLWTLPLGIYLASFVIVFAARAHRSVAIANRAMPIVLLPLVFIMSFRSPLPVGFELPLHLVVFAAIAVVCHGTIAADAPDERRLTEFFLILAAGGVLGAAIDTVVAPFLFRDLFEYPIALVAACSALHARPEPGRRRRRRFDVVWPACIGAALLATLFGIGFEPVALQISTALLAIGVATFGCFTFVARPLRFGLGVAAVFAATACRAAFGNDIAVERNFYGVKRVSATAGAHTLAHGHTWHGAEWMSPDLERTPLTYYTRAGPLGDIFRETSSGPAVAVVGLGAGSIACYRPAGGRWTFYEIDPQIVAIARDPHFFRYLADCAPHSRVVVGDGRLSLERAPAHSFDRIVLDAYSSDSIPTHLLTREAMQMYTGRLAWHGTIVFHISNSYFDFAPLIGALARDARMVVRGRVDTRPPGTQTLVTQSSWMIVARSVADLGALGRDPRWIAPPRAARVWTDDYSSIVTVLRGRS